MKPDCAAPWTAFLLGYTVSALPRDAGLALAIGLTPEFQRVATEFFEGQEATVRESKTSK